MKVAKHNKKNNIVTDETITNRNTNNVMIFRGDIYYADLPIFGSEQGGIRPVLIVQNNIGNRYSPTTVIVTLTSQSKNNMPTHVMIDVDEENGLRCDSTALCEQIKTIDKTRLINKIGHIDDDVTMNKISNAIKTNLGLL